MKTKTITSSSFWISNIITRTVSQNSFNSLEYHNFLRMTLVQSWSCTSCMSKYHHPVLRSPPVSLKSSQVRVSGNGCASVGLVEDGFFQVVGSSFCFSHFLEKAIYVLGAWGRFLFLRLVILRGRGIHSESLTFCRVPDLIAVSGVSDLMWSSCSLWPSPEVVDLVLVVFFIGSLTWCCSQSSWSWGLWPEVVDLEGELVVWFFAESLTWLLSTGSVTCAGGGGVGALHLQQTIAEADSPSTTAARFAAAM